MICLLALRVLFCCCRLIAQELAGDCPAIAAMLEARTRCCSGVYKGQMHALVAASGLPPSEIISQLAALAAVRQVGRGEAFIEEDGVGEAR